MTCEQPQLLCVLTTIQPPTACVRRLCDVLGRGGAGLLVIGDAKGPAAFDIPPAEFFSLEAQRRLPFALARQLPAGHYSRKNLGYLLAVSRGAACIYETDDDNRPSAQWRPRTLTTAARSVPPRPWMNVYRAFTEHHIWPRGFPLEALSGSANARLDLTDSELCVTAPIQQGLADGAPDVDAIWRLALEAEIVFTPGPSLYLPPGTWCPFNSQTTWWWPAAYPLLYLPSHCSFRMTDIWRSFVAQRCLWELGYGLVFHGPEVIQERNTHNLLGDFQDEVPGYLGNGRLTRRLVELTLTPGAGAVCDNLIHCYEALIQSGFLPRTELPLVTTWAEDLTRLAHHPLPVCAA